jgi:hypothetical protein
MDAMNVSAAIATPMKHQPSESIQESVFLGVRCGPLRKIPPSHHGSPGSYGARNLRTEGAPHSGVNHTIDWQSRNHANAREY